MLPAAPTETELKLQLAPRHVGRLRRSAALSRVTTSTIEVDSVYFDTADRLLRRHGMSLRVRRIDERWLQTLKTEGRRAGALSQRGEWETPAPVVRGRGRIDLARLAQSPLPELLARRRAVDKNAGPSLQPVFRTVFRRTLWLIEHDRAAIQVALDVGEISAEGASMREPICEVELELKRGEPEALIDLALELLDADGKERPALIPMARSKAERGYQLVAQMPAPAVKASAKAFCADLTSEAGTARALRSVLARGLAVLTANMEGLLQHDDPEYVHQARVALRRVRSAIRLFDRGERDVPSALTDELAWFARALGEVRDWDVIAEETLPSLIDKMEVGARADPQCARLLAAAHEQRRRARNKIRAAARSPRFARLVLEGERWCMTPPSSAADPIAGAAAPALRRAAKKLFAAARFFAALTPPRRHRVRIFAKRLRYALDLFTVALPKQASARYSKALSELQDALGQLNDATVAETVLPQLSKSARLRQSVHQKLAELEPARVRAIEARLLKLSKTKAPWSA